MQFIRNLTTSSGILRSQFHLRSDPDGCPSHLKVTPAILIIHTTGLWDHLGCFSITKQPSRFLPLSKLQVSGLSCWRKNKYIVLSESGWYTAVRWKNDNWIGRKHCTFHFFRLTWDGVLITVGTLLWDLRLRFINPLHLLVFEFRKAWYSSDQPRRRVYLETTRTLTPPYRWIRGLGAIGFHGFGTVNWQVARSSFGLLPAESKRWSSVVDDY